MMWIRGGGHAGKGNPLEGVHRRLLQEQTCTHSVREIKIDKPTKASSTVLITLAQGPGETPPSELKAKETGEQNKNKNLYLLSVYCVPSTVQIR